MMERKMTERKTKTLSKALAVILAAAVMVGLSGCGGGDSGGSSAPSTGGTSGGGTTVIPPNPNSPSLFTKSATWTITNLTKGAITCFDFDAQAESSCDGNTWDVKFENQDRGVKLWSNSGASGSGKGGVFGLMDWSELQKYKNATRDPATNSDISFLYNEDKNGGIFNQSPWYAYSLNDDHKLYPNNRVYLITTDNSSAATASSVQMPIYALQITNYYKGTASGFPTLRWIDTAMPNAVKTQQIDASSQTTWTYFNLQSGKVVDKSSVWHIAFKRDSIILNGGNSGMGKVGAYLASDSKAYYDDKGEPIKAKFMADNQEESLKTLQNVNAYQKPASEKGWVTDKKGSSLNPQVSGAYPKLDYGLFSYDGGNNHCMFANPNKGALIRSAEGNSFARMHLTDINYPDATSPAATSWVFKFDIQPATAAK